MLSIDNIKNIIESKYKDVEIDNKNYEESLYIKFDNKSDNFFKNYKLISVEKEKMDTFYYAECSGEYGEDTADISFKIENNAIELKHCLDIEITQQDIIDWIKTFISYKKISIRHNILVIFSIIEVEKKLCLFAENTWIFTATNSNEYWRLYNIIKNLKEY